ncbi:hypothetical protein BJX64DRAFT_268571 [Aspergillus heterothallicus]
MTVLHRIVKKINLLTARSITQASLTNLCVSGACRQNVSFMLCFPDFPLHDDFPIIYHDGQHMSSLMTTACDRAYI